MVGHFTKKGNEYIINAPDLKRPMLNYMWNKRILSAVNQNGGGNGGYRGMTSCYIGEIGKPRANMIGNGNRYFYIKDNQTGKLWNPGWYPVKEKLDSYSCLHGLGYSIIEGSKDNVKVTLNCTVSYDEPVEMWQVKVQNTGEEDKSITVFPFVEFALDGYTRYSEYESWVRAYFDETNNIIFAENPAEERPHEWFHGFCAVDCEVSGFDTSKNKFIGAYGDIRTPDALANGHLTNSLAACETMIGAFEINLAIKKGEEKIFNFIVGITNSKEEAVRVTKKLLKDGVFEETKVLHAKDKQKLCNLMNIQTPDEKLNNLANYWLKQQVQLCVEVGRGAGKGFRDQLQDSWAIAAFNPELSKTRIYETLEQIYHTGRCVRGWNPLKDWEASDGPTWVAPTVNAYLKESGDIAFLDEKVTYLDEGEDTVWKHILTTTRYSANDLGAHNLVLMHASDWNDSLNGLGKGGKGESVWTSIALYNSLLQVAEIARDIKHDSEVEKEMLERAEKLKKAINEKGWDGEWYLAGYDDNGKKVGSKEDSEGMIYLNSQTWATMLGIAPEEYKEKCLAAVDKYLNSDYGALTCYPPYTKYDSSIGRLTGFVPGIWENGAPYCHGASFKVISDLTLGRGDEGYKAFLKIAPDSNENPSSHSGCEPYAFTNMYLGPHNPRKGETSFAWITGTAGWIYRAVTQYMLGFHPGYDSAIINPCIPTSWKSFSGTRYFRGVKYVISVKNPDGKSMGVKEIILDGKKIETNSIPVFEAGSEHTVEVLM